MLAREGAKRYEEVFDLVFSLPGKPRGRGKIERLLTCPELGGKTVALKALTAARNARRRELRQGLRERAKVVDQLLACHGRHGGNRHRAETPSRHPTTRTMKPQPSSHQGPQPDSSSPSSIAASPSSVMPSAATVTSACATAHPVLAKRFRLATAAHGTPSAQSWSTSGSTRPSHPNPPSPRAPVFYTPKVHNTPRTVDKEGWSLHTRLSWAIETTLHPERGSEQLVQSDGPYTELVIVDEADRLKTPGLEALRDHHDRTGAGLILIGMPGIERRLARYPQLYSRVGFLHHYQPLSTDEQTFVLSRQWPNLGLDDTDDFTTREARAAIIRITGGNFRLTTRLMAQIHRIMDINQLSTVTSEVVDAARESLVIGIM
jgi:AAA domain